MGRFIWRIFRRCRRHCLGKILKDITIKPLWFAPLNNPMKLLIYSMAFGQFICSSDLESKVIMFLKDGKVVDFFCDVVFWYVLLIGLILMLLP